MSQYSFTHELEQSGKVNVKSTSRRAWVQLFVMVTVYSQRPLYVVSRTAASLRLQTIRGPVVDVAWVVVDVAAWVVVDVAVWAVVVDVAACVVVVEVTAWVVVASAAVEVVEWEPVVVPEDEVREDVVVAWVVVEVVELT
jgi:hypothetical protein